MFNIRMKKAMKIYLFFLGLIVCLMFVSISWHEWPLETDLGPNGYDYFYSIYKYPINLLLVGLSIFSLMLVMYRTKLNEKIIEQNDIQNKYSNYYNHMERFENYFKKTKIFKSFVYFNNINNPSHYPNALDFVTDEDLIVIRNLFRFFWGNTFKQFVLPIDEKNVEFLKKLINNTRKENETMDTITMMLIDGFELSALKDFSDVFVSKVFPPPKSIYPSISSATSISQSTMLRRYIVLVVFYKVLFFAGIRVENESEKIINGIYNKIEKDLPISIPQNSINDLL